MYFSLSFSGHRPNFLSQFGHNVRKCRLVNTVAANVNTITGQMNEMSQRKKLQFGYLCGYDGIFAMERVVFYDCVPSAAFVEQSDHIALR